MMYIQDPVLMVMLLGALLLSIMTIAFVPEKRED